MSAGARIWGSSAAERARPYPCDLHLPDAQVGARLGPRLAPWGELFMMRNQLLTLKELAEDTAAG